ncbi:MAG: FG-GAP repeat protein, partial [Planctomycetota bacterium]
MIQITNIRLAFLMILAIGSGFVIDAKNNAARSSKGNLTMRTKEYVPDALAASDWSSIRTAYEAGRHTAFPVDGGYRFLNPGQQWNTQFDGRGFVTNPDCGGWSWGLELQSYGIDGHEAPILNTSNVSAEGQRVLYKWDSNLTEWYKNDGRGLEHGYTVQARPANTKGTLVFNLAIRGSLQPRVQTNGRDVRFVDSSNASVLNYSGLTVLDANGTSLPARFESTNNSLQLFVDDLNAHYPLTIDPIAQQAYLKASNTGSADKFGSSVAISGNTIVVGAIGEDSNATGVNGNQSDNSASSSGAAYVFVRSGATWTQQAYLKASNAQSGDEFGTSVAISGDTIVVGAISEDSNSSGVNGDQTNNLAAFAGAAYVFVRSGTTWSQQA